MIYHVYILYSEAAKRFYIGQTKNLEDRLMRHNNGYEKSTAPYRPWRIVLSIDKESRGEAIILERKLKNLNTEDLIKFVNKYS